MVDVRNSFVATPPNDGGVLHSAALGAEFPETGLEALDAAFKANDHGAVDENGVGLNKSRSTQKIRMLGGGTFREPQTEYDESLTITLLEDDNTAVLIDEYGEENVEIETAVDGQVSKTIYHMPDQLPIQSWIVTLIDGKKTKRYLIELGQLTQTAEITDKHSDVTKHQWTITTYASTLPAFKGAHVVELRHDGSIVAVAGRGVFEGQQLRAAFVDSGESATDDSGSVDPATEGAGDTAEVGAAVPTTIEAAGSGATAAVPEKSSAPEDASTAEAAAPPAPTSTSKTARSAGSTTSSK